MYVEVTIFICKSVQSAHVLNQWGHQVPDIKTPSTGVLRSGLSSFPPSSHALLSVHIITTEGT